MVVCAHLLSMLQGCTCQKQMFIMLHCMSLAELSVVLFYVVFAIDCMCLIDVDLQINHVDGIFFI